MQYLVVTSFITIILASGSVLVEKAAVAEINRHIPPLDMTQLKLAITAMALATASSASAFTMDFIADLSNLPSGVIPEAGLVLNIPGYGDIRFTSINLTQYGALEVGNEYGAKGVQFNAPQELRVEFLGSLPATFDLNYSTAGLDSDEVFYQQNADPVFRSAFLKYTEEVDANDNYTGNGAAITGFTFAAEAIPEPSTSLLGLVGMAGLLARRRR
jgi:MYXO-CTERM domain-containing protein